MARWSCGSNGETRFIHSTIVGNEAAEEGGVSLLFSNDSMILENSIMWENSAPKGKDFWVNQGSVSAYASIFDPSQSIGNISGYQILTRVLSFMMHTVKTN